MSRTEDGSDGNDPIAVVPDAPSLVGQILMEAKTHGVSDVHLQCSAGRVEISWRKDGYLVPRQTWNTGGAAQVPGRIKFLAHMRTYDDRTPQDGRIDAAESGIGQDVRVAVYPTVGGEKIVLRLYSGDHVHPLDGIGFPPGLKTSLKLALRQPTGLILFTGPAGSGKTTTIYSCLEELRQGANRHIITIEDPVERVLPGIMQTEVNEARGLTYAGAARHLLRQDPQVLVVGEIRDDETAGLVVRAGLTGHLVLSTLHAGSCRGVIERLLVMSPDRSAIGAGLRMVVNQRLVRKTCVTCAGAGCGECVGTGYRGRLLVAEGWQPDDSARRALGLGQTSDIRPEPNLREEARRLVDLGLTTSMEVARMLGD